MAIASSRNASLTAKKNGITSASPNQNQKKEIDNILSTFGGSFMPDFGTGNIFDFHQSQNGWSMLLSSISGKWNNEKVKNTIKKINQEKALKFATKNDENGENFLRMVIGGDSTVKSNYINSIYNKYLNESKDIQNVKSFENSFEMDQELVKSPTHFKAKNNFASPKNNTIVQNEFSIKLLQESFNNMTDTLKNIRKANKFPK